MPAYIEVLRPSGREVVPLDEGLQVKLGRDPSNDVVLADDQTVSRLHAVLESYGASWCVRDMGSRNGTLVNGERIVSQRVLRSGDELRVGSSRIVYRAQAVRDPALETMAGEPAPELTRREKDILVALCRPLFSGDPFPQPGSVRQMARDLFVTEAAIKQHLIHLYDKFGIHGEGDRRVRLANEAVRRGAIAAADLRDEPRRR